MKKQISGAPGGIAFLFWNLPEDGKFQSFIFARVREPNRRCVIILGGAALWLFTRMKAGSTLRDAGAETNMPPVSQPPSER
jgi:hypothetical protein